MIKTSEEDLAKAFKEIEDAPDRTMAIVAACLLEAILEDAIITRLRPMSNTHRDALFEGESGFAGFAAKINLGFSLGLYGTKTKNELDYIRKIRNQFAHYIDRSFQHPKVTDSAKLITDYNPQPPLDDTKWSPAVLALLSGRDLRWRYLNAVMHFINGLFQEMKRVQEPSAPIALA
jgi:hypothetical protein